MAKKVEDRETVPVKDDSGPRLTGGFSAVAATDAQLGPPGKCYRQVSSPSGEKTVWVQARGKMFRKVFDSGERPGRLVDRVKVVAMSCAGEMDGDE